MGSRPQDFFSKRAKKEGYPARSVYKLMEINQRVRLLRSGQRVLDLGAAPGSWSLYAARQVGPKGFVLGIDRQAKQIKLPDNTRFLQADVLEFDETDLQAEPPFHVVLSDMAPSTSGQRHRDQYLSFELFMRALDIARAVLLPNGDFAAKIFQGAEFQEARNAMSSTFTKVRIIKPKASRDESYEVFMVGLQKLNSNALE